MTPWFLFLYLVAAAFGGMIVSAAGLIAYAAFFLVRLSLKHKTDPLPANPNENHRPAV